MKKILTVILLVTLSGCDYDTYLPIDEYYKIATICDNNKGIEAIGIIEVDPTTDNRVEWVRCNDGAEFDSYSSKMKSLKESYTDE